MGKTYKLSPGVFRQIAKGIAAPFTKTVKFWKALAFLMGRDTSLTFKGQGARDGEPPWRPFSVKTVASPSGKWRKRPGTDGSTSRRYGPKSKLLRASGGFVRSFGIQGISEKMLRFGTRHKLAGKIMRGEGSPFHRPVLFLTDADIRKYRKAYARFFLKAMEV